MRRKRERKELTISELHVNNKKYKVSYLTSTSNPYILFETALKNRIE